MTSMTSYFPYNIRAANFKNYLLSLSTWMSLCGYRMCVRNFEVVNTSETKVVSYGSLYRKVLKGSRSRDPMTS